MSVHKGTAWATTQSVALRKETILNTPARRRGMQIPYRLETPAIKHYLKFRENHSAAAARPMFGPNLDHKPRTLNP